MKINHYTAQKTILLNKPGETNKFYPKKGFVIHVNKNLKLKRRGSRHPRKLKIRKNPTKKKDEKFPNTGKDNNNIIQIKKCKTSCNNKLNSRRLSSETNDKDEAPGPAEMINQLNMDNMLLFRKLQSHQKYIIMLENKINKNELYINE